MTLDEITRYLHDHIPVTAHLGATVAAYDGGSIRVAAPLAPNLNHRGTAFGGSLSALGILAGWALLHLNLRARGIEARLVIQRSGMDYDAPVLGDFTATARLPDPAEWERFLATLARRGKARVTVRGHIGSAEGDAGAFDGAYVALRPAPTAARGS